MQVPSLQLQISLLSESLVIHGQYMFNVFLIPVISTDDFSVRFDGFATFIEGEDKYTYMVVDGIGYVVHCTGNSTTSVATQDVSCLSSVEAFSSLVSALNSITVGLVTTSNDEVVGCDDEGIIDASLGEGDIQICSGISGFMMYGESMLVRMECLDISLPEISAPSLTNTLDKCGNFSSAIPVTPSTLRLLSCDSITTKARDRGQ
ncbi:hypothetical protein PHMEG_00023100 [Phytophthora megakarya]|uniref:Uncharacterized protein n=1 Tax=Phytophthora megakarya TaxID=4795 RepID=A0A225VII5_9STRA|nr:hypothetical protein PHMEG_00023100 [Phytophthora megakarya]